MLNMPKAKPKRLRRPVPVMTRFTRDERKRLEMLVDGSGLSLQEYCRCRLLYIQFAAVGGHEPLVPPLQDRRPKLS